MAGNTKMREEMVREFIKCLSEETIPWHMAWSTDRPVNAVTNTRYRGINKMWLSFIQKMEGWEDPRWCTFKQASNKGWKIIKGSKGTPVEFWSLYDTQKKKKISYAEARELEENLTPEEYDKRIRLVSRVYSVFNAEQIDGISKYEAKKYDLDTERIMHIRDNLINNMNVGYSEEGDKAFYNPKHDRIVIPEMDRFETEYDYMATLFHEAGHATGHESRFNRQIANMFGSPEYAKEELRAEISSAFTAQAVGITYEQNSHMENHKAYIQSWISALKNNPNELFLAIKDAEKISDYLIEKAEIEKELTNEISKPEEVDKNEVTRDAEKISMTYSDAATFRMAMKGQKSAIEKFMNDEEIPQYIKNDSMAIGKEIGKYLDEGLGINEIIMKHIHDIDFSCGISNPAYTKKLVVELYSGTREEYELMMRLPDLSKEKTEFDDEQKVSKTVENVKKCVDVKNEMAEMRVPEAEPNIIRDVQKFAFENGYEHIDKIINEGQGFWGKTEKIRNWLMNVVEVNNNEDVRNEARQYLTRLDMLQPKFESQIISEKINNDPLFSISSRDLMEARVETLVSILVPTAVGTANRLPSADGKLFARKDRTACTDRVPCKAGV